jgi:hypothetical protein
MRLKLEIQPYFIDVIHAAEDVIHIRINFDGPLQKLNIISKLTKKGIP